MPEIDYPSALVFFLTVAATFGVTLLARRDRVQYGSDKPTDQKLNKWLLGLSAGATANSGFIVTGAVGLGYTQGLQWLLLPLGWLLGDIVFWAFFPGKINEAGQRTGAVTLSDLITADFSKRHTKIMALIIGTILFLGLCGYTSAQWLAGEKFLSGAFGISGVAALSLFALVIILYTSIGGFRGSIYADSLQAIIRICGTTIALVGLAYVAYADWDTVQSNLDLAGPDFLNPLSSGSIILSIGILIGYAAAAIGFGLGQPQIIIRYLAGKDAQETQAAWWIYIGFVQYTWIAMTVFGTILRGVMPNLPDPEEGLSIFFQSHFNKIIAGIIIADIFATIAATSNSLLVVLAQILQRDILNMFSNTLKCPEWGLTILIGALTMAISLFLHGSVVSVALSSVSLIGAGIAPAVMIRVMGWKHNEQSMIASVVVGIISAILWKSCGLGSYVNEAAIGIGLGLFANRALAKSEPTS